MIVLFFISSFSSKNIEYEFSNVTQVPRDSYTDLRQLRDSDKSKASPVIKNKPIMSDELKYFFNLNYSIGVLKVIDHIDNSTSNSHQYTEKVIEIKINGININLSSQLILLSVNNSDLDIRCKYRYIHMTKDDILGK